MLEDTKKYIVKIMSTRVRIFLNLYDFEPKIIGKTLGDKHSKGPPKKKNLK
jgi:hypothetical protein